MGQGLAQMLDALLNRRIGLRPCDFDTVDLPTYIGRVEGLEAVRLPGSLQAYDCRNNRLLLLALEQDGFLDAVAAAKARHGPERIGLFLGTSTSGIYQTELAYRQRDAETGALPASFHYHASHSTFSAADFAQRLLGLSGPAAVASSACSSSAKVFASAQRMIEAGFIDAAVVGGVDSLCLTTLYGFASLELTSAEPCRPYDADRKGISIGEAAAVALLERPDARLAPDAVLLTGAGESSDAFHMSSPHPQGLGAQLAMRQALAAAQLEAGQIDYINLHGTGTLSNDASEGRAVLEVFGADTPCSSTKGMTGHALGAAGGLEAIICALALQQGFMPGGANLRKQDPALGVHYLSDNRKQALQHVLSNSFGFGGTNCSLVFSRGDASCKS